MRDSRQTEQKEDERWICQVPEPPGVLAYGQTCAEAIVGAQEGKMSLRERIRSNTAWGLFFGILVTEGGNTHRLWSILGLAVLYIVGSSVVGSLLDGANRRWPHPLRWPRRRRANSGRS